MIDLFIIVEDIISLGSFLLLEIVLLRFVDGNRRVPFLLKLATGTWIVSFFLEYGVSMTSRMSMATSLTVVVLGAAHYWLFVALYLLSVFSFFESSLTIKIVTIICQNKDISRQALQRLYNKHIIISRRLQRLVALGELTYRDGKYTLSQHMGTFGLREKILLMVQRIYP